MSWRPIATTDINLDIWIDFSNLGRGGRDSKKGCVKIIMKNLAGSRFGSKTFQISVYRSMLIQARNSSLNLFLAQEPMPTANFGCGNDLRHIKLSDFCMATPPPPQLWWAPYLPPEAWYCPSWIGSRRGSYPWVPQLGEWLSRQEMNIQQTVYLWLALYYDPVNPPPAERINFRIWIWCSYMIKETFVFLRFPILIF